MAFAFLISVFVFYEVAYYNAVYFIKSFDLIKTRIQAGSGKGIFATVKVLVDESGGRVLQGLYKGFLLKLVRAIPASAIGFLTYEKTAKYISSK